MIIQEKIGMRIKFFSLHYRAEAGYCSISHAAVSSTSFQISLIAPSTSAAIAQVGDACTQDWIVIPGGGATAGATTNRDRWRLET